LGGILLLVPERPRQVVLQIGRQRVEPIQKRLVVSQLVEPAGIDRAQKRYGILTDPQPQSWIDRRK
jgi:hypothetical protein